MCWKPDLVRTNAPGRILLLGRFVSYAMDLGPEAAEIVSDCEKNTSAIDIVLLSLVCIEDHFFQKGVSRLKIVSFEECFHARSYRPL